jgi:SAM-dependent methyltransferase
MQSADAGAGADRQGVGMRIGPIAESFVEWLVLKFNLAPVPMMDTQVAMLLARIVMVATKVGLFESLKDGPKEAAAVAGLCGTHPRGTEKMLMALVSARYLKAVPQGYALTPMVRKWLLKDSPTTIWGKMMFHFEEWDVTARIDDYIATGASLDLHGSTSAETWSVYQRAMRDIARVPSAEIARRLDVPSGARRLLDIGGSHGLYSVELCRRHRGLEAVILDLPQAVEHAAPLLAEEGMGDRVRHQVGNALTDDLGEGTWDVVFMSSLVHHFDEPTNRALTQRIARALKPGGLFAIQEQIRTATRFDADRPDKRLGAMLDLYFAATSASGCWAIEEMNDWQRSAGLVPGKPLPLRTVPGAAVVTATKP